MGSPCPMGFLSTKLATPLDLPVFPSGIKTLLVIDSWMHSASDWDISGVTAEVALWSVSRSILGSSAGIFLSGEGLFSVLPASSSRSLLSLLYLYLFQSKNTSLCWCSSRAEHFAQSCTYLSTAWGIVRFLIVLYFFITPVIISKPFGVT